MANLQEGITNLVKKSGQKRFPELLPTDYQLEGEEYDPHNYDYLADGEPITGSERGFHLAVDNDMPVYDYISKNRQALRDRLSKGEDYGNILRELKDLGTWSKGTESWNPKNVRKEYLARLLEAWEE